MIKSLSLMCIGGVVLYGCTSIKVQPSMPFVKITIPATTQIFNSTQNRAVISYKQQGLLHDLEIKRLEIEVARLKAANRQRPVSQRPVAKPVSQRPIAKPVSQRPVARSGCEHLHRDLSRPNSNVIYCRPKK